MIRYHDVRMLSTCEIIRWYDNLTRRERTTKEDSLNVLKLGELVTQRLSNKEKDGDCWKLYKVKCAVTFHALR